LLFIAIFNIMTSRRNLAAHCVLPQVNVIAVAFDVIAASHQNNIFWKLDLKSADRNYLK